MINFKQFQQVEMKVGLIQKVENIEESDKLFLLKVDVGDAEPRQLVAGLKGSRYDPEELEEKKVIVVTNLEPKELLGYKSQGMILAAMDESKKLSLLTVDKDIAVGSKVS